MSAKFKFARTGVAGLAIAAFTAMPALAADVVFEEPPAPQPAPVVSAPIADWSGPYAGVHLGYGFSGEVDYGPFDNNISTDGFIGGAFGGFQMQDGMFVYGIEGDVNYNDASGRDDFLHSRSRLDGSIRGRVGVAVTDDVLIYGTAGGAAERRRLTDEFTGVRDTNVMLGYTVGAGVDAKLTDQVFGRIEYRYTDYGSENFDLGYADAVSADSSNHRVMVGIGMQF